LKFEKTANLFVKKGVFCSNVRIKNYKNEFDIYKISYNCASGKIKYCKSDNSVLSLYIL